MIPRMAIVGKDLYIMMRVEFSVLKNNKKRQREFLLKKINEKNEILLKYVRKISQSY